MARPLRVEYPGAFYHVFNWQSSSLFNEETTSPFSVFTNSCFCGAHMLFCLGFISARQIYRLELDRL